MIGLDSIFIYCLLLGNKEHNKKNTQDRNSTGFASFLNAIMISEVLGP